jgi:hypothetical protein
MAALTRRFTPPVKPVLVAADLAVWIGEAYRIGVVLG